MTSRPVSPWSSPEVVAGFVRSPPNQVLMRFAAHELARRRAAGQSRAVALDLGCGAGRNALPLAGLGWEVFGFDDSAPMLAAAATRARESPVRSRLHFALAAMDRIPLPDRSCDLVVAHGIWNLAHSAAEFRRALREASRVALPRAALFVFTFSRHTFPPGTEPVGGETFVFTQFSGQPQCFLTAGELFAELAAVGFEPDPAVPLTEYNRLSEAARPVPQRAGAAGPPVIYETAFRFAG